MIKEVQPFHSFQKLTNDEIKKLIGELQTKSCELDIVPCFNVCIGAITS